MAGGPPVGGGRRGRNSLAGGGLGGVSWRGSGRVRWRGRVRWQRGRQPNSEFGGGGSRGLAWRFRRQTMHDSDHDRGFPRVTLLLVISAIVAPIHVRADEQKAERAVLESRGHLVPGSQITVSPKVAGQVVELLIEEGKRVKAGDVLARLDAEEYEAVLRLARARLKLAEAGLAKAERGRGRPTSPSPRRGSRSPGPRSPWLNTGWTAPPSAPPSTASSWRSGPRWGRGSTRGPRGARGLVRHGRPAVDGGRGLGPGAGLGEGREGAGVRGPGGCRPERDLPRPRRPRTAGRRPCGEAPWRFAYGWRSPRRTSGFGPN